MAATLRPHAGWRLRAQQTGSWLAPVGAALVLRLWNVGRQILVEDELHSLNIALNESVGEILFTYRESDPCLPLTALFRLLMDWGVRLSEALLRAPSLVAGVATVVVLPLMARPWLDRGERLAWSWLLALSPLLVLYSRIVRPYALVALLGPLAVLAFLRWWRGGRWRWAALYVLAALGSLWLHLTVGPFVLSPLAVAWAHGLSGRDRQPRRRPLLVLTTVTAVGLVGLFLPASDSLLQLLGEKRGEGVLLASAVRSTLTLHAGTVAASFAVPFWLAAGWGLLRVWRSAFAWVLFALGAVAAQLFGVIVFRPTGIGNPLILSRYLLVVLPLVLALVSSGLCYASRQLVGMVSPPSLRSSGRVTVLAVVLALWVLAGPFTDGELRRSSLMHWKDFLRFDVPRGDMVGRRVPRFYYRLAEEAGSGPVAEFPFRSGWAATRAHYVYQAIHGRPVLAVQPGGLFCDERLALRNHVCAEPPHVLASRARYLVVHRRVRREERWVEGGDDTGLFVDPRGWRSHHELGRMWQERLRRQWGRPLFRNRAIMAWDLDAVRHRVRRPSGVGGR